LGHFTTLACNASSGRVYVSTSPDLCPLLDFTLESENPAYNDNKENCATDEDSACTMTLTVPNAITKVVIFKNGKRSENPALNRVVQQVTLPEWFVIFLFSK
jgi:hypothetical protein